MVVLPAFLRDVTFDGGAERPFIAAMRATSSFLMDSPVVGISAALHAMSEIAVFASLSVLRHAGAFRSKARRAPCSACRVMISDRFDTQNWQRIPDITTVTSGLLKDCPN